MARIMASHQPGLRTRLARLTRLSGAQKIALMVALALSVAIVWAFWLASGAQPYRPLYANLSDRDGGAILAALDTLAIPYRTEADGVISVPQARLHEARLRLAAQGLPKGSASGFELLDTSRFGTSQFAEQIKYQRALEGELKRSIEQMDAVKTARVHLAMPRSSAFLRESQEPSASVLLILHSGRTLDAKNVNGIVQLVASSVPGLSTNRVAVVDSSGAVLGVPNIARPSGAAAELDYARQIEQEIAKRIEDILAPLAGADNVRIQVSADTEMLASEQAPANAQSMPASDDQAATPAVEPKTATADADKPASADLLRKLSVAVVLDNKHSRDPAGHIVKRPWTPAELTQIETLVRDAIGYDAGRGDSLNIVNSPFISAEPSALPASPWWHDPLIAEWGRDLARYGLLLVLVAMLILGLVRPLLREFTRGTPPIEPLPEWGSARETEQADQSVSHQHNPRAVADVIKSWVRDNE